MFDHLAWVNELGLCICDTCWSPIKVQNGLNTDIPLLQAYENLNLNPAFNFNRYIRRHALLSTEPDLRKTLHLYQLYWSSSHRIKEGGSLFLKYLPTIKLYT